MGQWHGEDRKLETCWRQSQFQSQEWLPRGKFNDKEATGQENTTILNTHRLTTELQERYSKTW